SAGAGHGDSTELGHARHRDVEQGRDVGEVELGAFGHLELQLVAEADRHQLGEHGAFPKRRARVVDQKSVGPDTETALHAGGLHADDVAPRVVVEGAIEDLEVPGVRADVGVDAQRRERAFDVADEGVVQVPIDDGVGGDVQVAHQGGEL